MLAAAEKRLLVWIARKLPVWLSSDHLTALALASMAAAGLSFAAVRISRWWALAVVFMLAANWFGDSLDGTLARVRGRERPRYGFYIDHAVDLAGTTLLLSGMAVSGVMAPIVAVGVLAAYLLVAAETYLATHARAVFKMSFGGLGPTELRLVLAVGAVKLIDSAWISPDRFHHVRLFDAGGAIAIVGLLAMFVRTAWRNAQALHAEESLPLHVSERP
jgi:phosphatidylglycerophosphate synthase